MLETPIFLANCRAAGVTDAEHEAIVNAIAADPKAGKVIEGTGGARKIRFARAGGGKSGGYRTIHYFGGDDVPVFLLQLYAKNERENLTMAQRNTLRSVLAEIAEDYRKRRP